MILSVEILSRLGEEERKKEGCSMRRWRGMVEEASSVFFLVSIFEALPKKFDPRINWVLSMGLWAHGGNRSDQ